MDEPDRLLTAVTEATERLLATVEDLSDADLAAASKCPGWSRAQVVAHVAGNADALVNLLTWARTGEVTPQYADAAQRQARIDAGAGRSAAELAEDLRAATVRFTTAVAQMPAAAWDARVRTGVAASGREISARRVPWQRLKEVEIHHVDLDRGYTPAHWSPEFVERGLAETLRMFDRREDCPALTVVATEDGQARRVHDAGPDAPVVRGPAAALLGWLTGRTSGDGLLVEPAGPPPRLPAWA